MSTDQPPPGEPKAQDAGEDAGKDAAGKDTAGKDTATMQYYAFAMDSVGVVSPRLISAAISAASASSVVFGFQPSVSRAWDESPTSSSTSARSPVGSPRARRHAAPPQIFTRLSWGSGRCASIAAAFPSYALLCIMAGYRGIRWPPA